MNFFNQTTPAIQRVHDQMGRDVTVSQFSWDETAGSTDYADGDWVETTKTVSVTIRQSNTPEDDDEASGADLEGDATIYVQPNDVDVEIGTDDETRATEFLDPQTDKRYRVINVHHQDSLLEVDCEVL